MVNIFEFNSPEIPWHLLVRIIQKIDCCSFIVLRRSCKAIESFIQEHLHLIRIRVNKKLNLKKFPMIEHPISERSKSIFLRNLQQQVSGFHFNSIVAYATWLKDSSRGPNLDWLSKYVSCECFTVVGIQVDADLEKAIGFIQCEFLELIFQLFAQVTVDLAVFCNEVPKNVKYVYLRNAVLKGDFGDSITRFRGFMLSEVVSLNDFTIPGKIANFLKALSVSHTKIEQPKSFHCVYYSRELHKEFSKISYTVIFEPSKNHMLHSRNIDWGQYTAILIEGEASDIIVSKKSIANTQKSITMDVAIIRKGDLASLVLAICHSIFEIEVMRPIDLSHLYDALENQPISVYKEVIHGCVHHIMQT